MMNVLFKQKLFRLAECIPILVQLRTVYRYYQLYRKPFIGEFCLVSTGHADWCSLPIDQDNNTHRYIFLWCSNLWEILIYYEIFCLSLFLSFAGTFRTSAVHRHVSLAMKLKSLNVFILLLSIIPVFSSVWLLGLYVDE